MATAAQIYTVTIQSVEIKSRTPFGPRYSWQTGENYEYYLNITGVQADGSKVYFNTPTDLEMHIASAPGVAVVTWYNDGKGKWMSKPESYCVSSGQSGVGSSPASLVKIGDKISVKGKVKQVYKSGVALSNIKRV